MPATTEAARDAFVAASIGDSPAFDLPHSRDELRQLEGMAWRIVTEANRDADEIEAMDYGRANRMLVDRLSVALLKAEALDAYLTSEAVGVVVAEIREAFALRVAA